MLPGQVTFVLCLFFFCNIFLFKANLRSVMLKMQTAQLWIFVQYESLLYCMRVSVSNYNATLVYQHYNFQFFRCVSHIKTYAISCMTMIDTFLNSKLMNCNNLSHEFLCRFLSITAVNMANRTLKRSQTVTYWNNAALQGVGTAPWQSRYS